MPLTIDTTEAQDRTISALVESYPDADFWIDPITTTDQGQVYFHLSYFGVGKVLQRTIWPDGSIEHYKDDDDDLIFEESLFVHDADGNWIPDPEWRD